MTSSHFEVNALFNQKETINFYESMLKSSDLSLMFKNSSLEHLVEIQTQNTFDQGCEYVILFNIH